MAVTISLGGGCHHCWPLGSAWLCTPNRQREAQETRNFPFYENDPNPSNQISDFALQQGVTRIVYPDNAVLQVFIPLSLNPIAEVFR